MLAAGAGGVVSTFLSHLLQQGGIGVRFSVRQPVVPATIYVDTSILVHSNDLLTHTTASMNLKFHLQHDQTRRLQNSKI